MTVDDSLQSAGSDQGPGETRGARAARSYGCRIQELAQAHPERTAIIAVGQSGDVIALTWKEYDQWSDAVARLLSARGVRESSLVVVALPNECEHFVAMAGAWKLGARTLALNAKAPVPERAEVLVLAAPAVVIGDWEGCGAIPRSELSDARKQLRTDSISVAEERPTRAVASGGTTGRPKIISLTDPVEGVPGDVGLFGEIGGMAPGQVQLVVGPLYHNMPQLWSHMGLFHDQTLVVMERFDARLAVDLIERYHVSFSAMVPTHLLRMARLPDIGKRDLSSLQAILHSGAACPEWVKRAWIELVGPEKVYEAYGATEAVGVCAIRGDEWLEHPGSVGRPVNCELKILDQSGQECSPGQTGEIFTRPLRDTVSYEYIGSERAKCTDDGFVSVGDLGWTDEKGYLFVADRRVDMIVSGGVNIYPAEIEAALSQHPAVADAVVIGLRDPELGRRIHAIVEPARGFTVTPEQLLKHCAERLSLAKVPRTLEFVAGLPRNDAGKIRRSLLLEEREALPPARTQSKVDMA